MSLIGFLTVFLLSIQESYEFGQPCIGRNIIGAWPILLLLFLMDLSFAFVIILGE
jgi:hypothetical protein